MTTDDFVLDQVERFQRHQTRRRRDGRGRRQRLYALVGLAFVVVLVLGAPSLVSHSSIGRSIIIRGLAGYGLLGNVGSMRIGWITPLRVSGLEIQGDAGSRIVIDQLDMDITVTDFIGRASRDLGQIAVRGVMIDCALDDGVCNLEQDLGALLEPSSDSAGPPTATLKLQDIAISVKDLASGGTWQVSQSNADAEMGRDQFAATFAGVLTEPTGSGGSLQGSVKLAGKPGDDWSTSRWELELSSESLPLSVLSLVRRRFPATAKAVPLTIHGDATGAVLIKGLEDGTTELAVRELKVRNLTAADEGSRVWNNGLATLDGELVLAGNRVIGRQLRATTDFASATIDGAFSRTFSLVGANDNPLRWLEAIDGTATAEIDLAAFDRSLPGLLPLRDEAQIVSGRAVARVDSLSSGSVRRSQLTIRSDALRARARGRAVVVDPIELAATVSRQGGGLRADHFEWKSMFGSAIGQGDLRSGSADFELDFGRFSAMLRPIIQVSETTLAGAARGKISWNASADDVWRLSGAGDATNLLITLPGGQSLKRPTLRGEVEAVGRWGGQSLEELSRAAITLASSGLDLQAQLEQPVRQPSATMPMPVRVQGTGRIETLAEVLGPWLPPELHSTSGGFAINARGEISPETTRMTSAAIELTEPRFALGPRYFSQPSVTVHFDGDYRWPSRDFRARSFTVGGDAFSMATRGQATAQQLDLEVKWLAKLERIQGSVRKQMASRRGPVRQVGYRPTAEVATDDWLVRGDCQGSLSIQGDGDLIDISVEASGTDLSIIQPARVSAGSRVVGPMPRPNGSPGTLPPADGARTVWSEPNLKINGLIRYDDEAGRIVADGMQLAGDWFATTLSGQAIWNDTAHEVELEGPARLKMDQVATRLSSLAGVQIAATGVHQTPLRIRLAGPPQGDLAFAVEGNLGWESSEVAGVQVGPATVPMVLTETSVRIAPSRVPVGEGFLNLAGQVHYRPGPLWMRLDRGVLAESIRLTAEMTDRWLKYLAPLAADAARVQGMVGAEIDEAVIVFDQPQLSRVTGRLKIAGAEMTASPMSNQILAGVEQLKSLARSFLAQPVAAAPTRTLISMPAQTVDFVVDRGVVTHERLFFKIDRAQVVTSGHVFMDGRLDMIAQIPLDASWLGSDLQGLAGHSVTLPIDGTLSRPSLDSSGVRQVVQQLGAQAIQNTAENYLQQQLNRGIEKIFGR